MEINWNTAKAKGLIISSYSYANIETLKEGIRETRSVQFVIFPCTKTSVNIEISCPKKDGRHNFYIAHIPARAEKFKFLEKTTCGIFDNKPRTRYHFKLNKKQGIPELKEYLAIILKEYVPDVESVDADLLLYDIEVPQEA